MTNHPLFTGLKALHDSIDPENKVQIIAFNSRFLIQYFNQSSITDETLFFKVVFCGCFLSVQSSLTSRRHFDNLSQRLIKRNSQKNIFFIGKSQVTSSKPFLFIDFSKFVKSIFFVILLSFTLKAPSVHGYNTHSEYIDILETY